MKFGGNLREIFSGSNGKLSAKRIVGGIAMIVALSSTVYLVVKDGSNDTVENLLTTVLLLAAYLLGLPAITGVFGKSRITSIGDPNMQQPGYNPYEQPHQPEYNPYERPQQTEYNPYERPQQPYDPCENCPHNKRESF